MAACGQPDERAAFTGARLPPGLSPRYWAPDGWGWGVVRLRGKPALRYGVAAPPGMSTGEVIIMTGYGETAEGWFETARDLVALNYSVWVIEAAGQGGSGRYKLPRDLGRAQDFEADIEGVRALTVGVIRPKPSRPVTLIASGSAAPAAIAALARGLPAASLILSAPGDAAVPKSAGPWVRPADPSALTVRQRAQSGWMIANPDLRMGGPSPGWRTAWSKLASETSASVTRVRINSQVLVLTPEASAQGCASFKHCRLVAITARGPYLLEADTAHGAWLSAVLSALAGDHRS